MDFVPITSFYSKSLYRHVGSYTYKLLQIENFWNYYKNRHFIPLPLPNTNCVHLHFHSQQHFYAYFANIIEYILITRYLLCTSNYFNVPKTLRFKGH